MSDAAKLRPWVLGLDLCGPVFLAIFWFVDIPHWMEGALPITGLLWLRLAQFRWRS